MAILFGGAQGFGGMDVIPVLDLMGGAVVHARMGQRGQYRPIETPLSSTSKPIDVARGLLSIYPFKTIYVADLWVDNGVADRASAQNWLDADLGNLVLGSEAQEDGDLVRTLSMNDRIILSLDYRGDAFVGPGALLSDADAWPNRVIVMTLARVGSTMGPDWNRLLAIKRCSAERLVYAAGGVRDAHDLAALARTGIAGALVASCLHNCKLAGAQIARLQES
jgi:phosphoribosylformimino-5-aminoimidazole carboxamide ribotide isomerase